MHALWMAAKLKSEVVGRLKIGDKRVIELIREVLSDPGKDHIFLFGRLLRGYKRG